MNQRAVVEVGVSVPLVLLAVLACRFRMRLGRVGVCPAFGSTWDRPRHRPEVCRGVVLVLTPADSPRDGEGYFELSAVVVEGGLHNPAEEEHWAASSHAGGLFPLLACGTLSISALTAASG